MTGTHEAARDHRAEISAAQAARMTDQALRYVAGLKRTGSQTRAIIEAEQVRRSDAT